MKNYFGKKHSKIFGLGLSRTGTTSLHAALVLLGKSSIHYPSEAARHWLAGDFSNDYLADFEACLDLPTPVYFRELDNAYPGSLFILTVRNEKEWLESVEKFLKSTTPPNKKTHFRDMIRLTVYGTFYFHKERFRRVFNEHNDAVKKYFLNRPDKLMVMDITSGDEWSKLTAFLGINKIPEISFPNLKSPYLGPCSAVKHNEVDTKRDLLGKMFLSPDSENNYF